MSSERFKTQELIQETLRILKSEELPGLIAALSYIPFSVGCLFGFSAKPKIRIFSYSAVVKT